MEHKVVIAFEVQVFTYGRPNNNETNKFFKIFSQAPELNSRGERGEINLYGYRFALKKPAYINEKGEYMIHSFECKNFMRNPEGDKLCTIFNLEGWLDARHHFLYDE